VAGALSFWEEPQVIYHRIGLTKAEIARLRRTVKVMLENDRKEIANIESMPGKRDPLCVNRLDELEGRRKFITKANLLRIFALRGLEDMEQGGNEEETIDLMVRLGRAKGRPDGRR
jgi:hypothetical protein